MRRALAALFLVAPIIAAFPAPAEAQDASGPILRSELEKSSAVPGQPIVLRITILVPTWMPKPPEFPSFEVPNVMVRLPERASGPTSEPIDGETWSGVTRAYRLYPMTVGRFQIQAQPIVVTYADPDTQEPVVVELRTEDIIFEGVAPQGAGGLIPFIAAEKLTIEQTIEGEPGNLEPGNSFERSVTARIAGTTPIVLPALIPPLTEPGIAAYPREPVVNETDNRGALSGTRAESVTYVAQAGARVSVPPIRLRWFNLKSGQIETAETDGFEIVSRGPLPEPPTAFDWRAVLPRLVLGAVIVAALAMAIRWAWPRVAVWQRRRHAAWLASERCAFEQALAALKQRNFSAATRAIDHWALLCPSGSDGESAQLSMAMAGLGMAYYGSGDTPPSPGQWSDVTAALTGARRTRLAASASALAGKTLPPLNPRAIPR